MPGGSEPSRQSSIGPKTRSFLAWAAGGRPALPKKKKSKPETSSAGGEERDTEPGGPREEEHHHRRHHHRHRSGNEEHHRRHRSGSRHRPSTAAADGKDQDAEARRRREEQRHHHRARTSSGERRSGDTHPKPHSSSAEQNQQQHRPRPLSSSHHHHRSIGVSRSNSSSRKPLPFFYTSYSHGSSASRDAKSSSSAVPSASEQPPVPPRNDFVPPSTAPTIPEEDYEEDEETMDRRASVSVGPWDSISVAGLDPDQYNAYIATAKEKYKEPPGEADVSAAATSERPMSVPSSSSDGRSRRHNSHQETSYSSSQGRSSKITPPPRYSHGLQVPWQDSAYHSAIGNRLSSSSQSRQLPAYTSHDYVHNQQQEHPAVAPYRAVAPQTGYTMNSAYRTMPDYEAEAGYAQYDGSDGAVGNAGDSGYGDVIEEHDEMNFEYEEDGDRRHVRGSLERTVRRASGRMR
ncbi:uncharacterized protein PG986_012905 [Apiospora aurea]|uniref:Uncharacterized protein n=1 Tax=Apiospora aurea TaxID=335848 RepID=A0ABR1Q203_9PEZI